MSMWNPSRLGQANLAGDTDALFLMVYGGEVLKTFNRKVAFAPRTRMKSITSGKSAQFPALGRSNAQYHTPGTELKGQNLASAERTILIDDVLIADHFIAQIDELKSHFETRSEYAEKAGEALAIKMDSQIAQVGVLAARASATITGLNGGTRVEDADGATSATSLAASLYDIAQAMDEKEIPESDRTVFLRPAQYYLLVESSDKLIDADFNRQDNGSYASGIVRRIAGMEIVKTNRLPSTVVADGPAAYQGSFTNHIALVLHKEAIGTVKLMDLATESTWITERQGTLLLAKQAVGHGILRPECAGEVYSS